ncbi:MAG: SIS domain-containing protein [Terriglobia bacterium]
MKKRPGLRFNRSQAVTFAAREVAASCEVKHRLGQRALVELARLVEASVHALRAGRRIYLLGNGGSAADAQHIAAELLGHFRRQRTALSALALTTDTSVLTAVSNDYGFEKVFVRQVEGLVGRGDLVIGITTSGRSTNVIQALRRTRELGGVTAALAGAYTRRLHPVTDFLFAVPSHDSKRIQEVHALVGHIYCDLIEQYLFGRPR